MEHEEFIAAYQARQIRCYIDRQVAFRICQSPAVPDDPRNGFRFWGAVGCFLPLCGLALFFFVKWYWATAVFLGGWIMLSTLQNAAVTALVEAAVEDKDLYHRLFLADIIRIYRTDGTRVTLPSI